MRVELLIIDPQNDFCDPSGSLSVPGADQDMIRLADMVRRLKHKLDDIHVTLDSHRLVDISHPSWWRDRAGNPPAPFTQISTDDLKSGRWTTTQPSAYRRSLKYLEDLDKTNRYPHVIWPPHCLIGSWGHSIYPELFQALQEWEERFALVDFVTKGSNPWTEHFSAVKAEVPDPEDPTTHVNTGLIQTLEEADIILLAGEAKSHCMANTVRDIADCFSNPKYVEKLVLLVDATSRVPDPPGTTLFTDLTVDFMQNLTARGMKISTTTEVLKEN